MDKENQKNSMSGFRGTSGGERKKEESSGKKKDIEYHKESVYGVHKNYYNDPEVAKHMMALTGQKTLNDNHIPHLIAMGHTVKETPVPSSGMQTGRSIGSSNGYLARGNPTAADEDIA